MTCALPPIDELDRPDNEDTLHILLHDQCSLSLDPDLRAGVLILHGLSPLAEKETLCGIALDEKGLSQTILQLQALLKKVRLLPLSH